MTRQTRVAIGVAGWLLALGVSTTHRARVWQSDRALWTDARSKAPTKPRPVLNYGRMVELDGNAAAAEAIYRDVIVLAFDERRPVYMRRFSLAAAEVNIAHLYMKDGRMASAMRILDSTLQSWPEFPYAHYNKGAILWVYGACAEARAEYQQAHTWDPSLPIPSGPCGQPSSTP